MTIWRDKLYADNWFADHLGRSDANGGPKQGTNAEITYALGSLIGFETGNGVHRWDDAVVGDAIGFKASTVSFEEPDMDRYVDEVDALRTGPDLPPGVALHAVAMFEDGPMAFQLSDEDPFGPESFGEFDLTLDDLSEYVPAVRDENPLKVHTVTLGETLAPSGRAFQAKPGAWHHSAAAHHSPRPLFLHGQSHSFAGQRASR